MVSRLFSTAGSLISQVGEVLAPPVHSSLEDLRDHWKAIKKFYIDENGILFAYFLFCCIIMILLFFFLTTCNTINDGCLSISPIISLA